MLLFRLAFLIVQHYIVYLINHCFYVTKIKLLIRDESMKKILLFYLIAVSLFISSVFASNSSHMINDCLRYIDQHRFQFLLDLSDCRLQDKDVPFVLSYLSQNPSVSIVFLDDNNIGTQGAKLLAHELRVDYLGLDDNHIGSEGVKYLAENKYLYGLSVASNHIKTAGALALAKSSILNNLNVEDNDIQPDGITALANVPQMTFLSVAENTLDDKSIAALINNKNITGLDVSYTDIRFNQVISLLERPKLDSLSINGLHLGDPITTYLTQQKSLRYLDMIENNITEKGVAVLATLIHDDFTDLNLSHNPIGDQGLAALSKANTSFLPFLSIEDANISDQGAVKLANIAMTILELNISHNLITSYGISALQNNPKIIHFDASYNQEMQINASNHPIYRIQKEKYQMIHLYCANTRRISCLRYLRNNFKLRS